MSDRTRILHVLRAPVGGLFRHVLDLSGEQSALGHDVGLVMDSTTADALTERRIADIAPQLCLGVTRIPMSRLPGLGDLTACRAVRDVAKAKRVDVLHGHGAKGGAYARLAGILLRRETGARRVAIFYTPHGGSLHFPPRSPQGIIYIVVERYLARLTDGLIFESDFARRVFDERVGKNLAEERVITNALQPSDFITHVPEPDAADFLFVGELRRLKGVDVLLNALAAIAQQRPVSALIVGSGADREELEFLAADLDLENKVTFAGAMPAREVFPRARCIVVPSRAESLPYIVLESAAARMPLLATNVGGIPEIVTGSDTPLLPPGDIRALTSAMSRFLDAPEEARARAKRLQDVVYARFAIGSTTAAVLKFYADRLGR